MNPKPVLITFMFLLFALPMTAQQAVQPKASFSLLDIIRDQQQFQGPSGVLNSQVDAWVRGDKLYYRSAKLPLTTPYQVIPLSGRASQIAAADGKLYVWVGDLQLYAFTAAGDDSGIDPVPLPLAADNATARRALESARPASPPSVQAATPDSVALVSPPRLYVANFGADSMSVINVATNTLINTIPLNSGDVPVEIAIAPDNSKGYIADFGCQSCINRGVTVFDPVTGTPQPTHLAGIFPYCLAVSNDGTRIYVRR